MTDGLFIILCAVAVVGTSVIWIQARRIRQLQRKVDVHAEALRMLAQPINVELPPEPPTKPDLKVLKGGLVAFTAATTGTLTWVHRHAGASSTIAAGLVGGVLAGVLVFTNLARRPPTAARPPAPPLISQYAPAPAQPSASLAPTPPTAPATPPSAFVAPVAIARRPSPLPRPVSSSTQTATAAPSPVRSSPSFPPSSSRPLPCPIGLTLRLDPVLRIEVCA